MSAANTTTKTTMIYECEGCVNGECDPNCLAGGSIIQEARDWIADSFEDAPDDLTDRDVIEGIRRHYIGGMIQFIADGK